MSLDALLFYMNRKCEFFQGSADDSSPKAATITFEFLQTTFIVYVAFKIQWLSHYSSDPVDNDRQHALLDNGSYPIIIRRTHVVFLDVFLPDLFSSFISVTNMVPRSKKLTETYLCNFIHTKQPDPICLFTLSYWMFMVK